ncbi:TetR/AcrR family transcriptional regulator [Kribbia dieselivorans]|uniref:TetR/AcrR family transcriptional regulator n=1 Tax=Kribbia dieselivorans TaxID=331526 RepID=UPI000838AA6E|nr:TetR/AcrR family transcriptional regulator [Kribbia dieselivorans]
MPTTPKVGRTDRRRALNRQRLLDAAVSLVAEVGADALTVSAVTERADLGAGTFYNHFASREELITEVVRTTVETLGQRLDAMSAPLEDAAEVYGFSLRHLMGAAVSDPLWGWLMVRLGVAHDELLATLGPRARRDLAKGMESGRFRILDLDIATAITFGALLSTMRVYLAGERDVDPSVVFAETMLRMVGLSPAEARDVAHRPLPPLRSLEEVEAGKLG